MRGKKEIFDILIEEGEDGFFIASVPALPGCHTQAKSLDMLMKRIQEAIQLYLEVKKDRVKPATRIIGLQRVEVSI
jgi:predicted RNase H-like HicB family nuclease